MSKYRAVFTFTDGETHETDYTMDGFSIFGKQTQEDEINQVLLLISGTSFHSIPDDKGGFTVYLKYQVAKIYVTKLPEEQTT
jgi:hypothetical protein